VLTERARPADDSRASAFGTLLRRFRLSAGFSQEGLAERAGLSVDAIGMLERGIRRAPYSATVDLLVDALGLEASDREVLASAINRKRAPRTKRGLAARAPLPAPLTPLIGRAFELAAAGRILADRQARLLTITGTGGVGKTRFAVELAHDRARDFEAGVLFVALAAIRDPAHIAASIFQCMVRAEDGTAASLDALCARVGTRRAMFLVDNLEQVLSGAPILSEFLERCPEAVILATSREALRIRGEYEFALRPLDLDASVQLLRERADAVRPGLDDALDREFFEPICRRLDGLPLAIELTAGLLRHDSAKTVLDRLSSRLDALVSGTRDSPQRQRTIRDTCDWSYGLLNQRERSVFGVAGLFAGSGSLEAVRSICRSVEGHDDGAGAIKSLADKNLLMVRNGMQAPRFEMLETIREYAHERLAASEDFAEYQQAFATHYEALTHNLTVHRGGAAAAAWMNVVALDYENVRAVLRWAIARDRSLGLRLALDLVPFWERKGYYAESRQWLEALVDPLAETVAREEPKTMWRIFNALGLAYYWAGDLQRACPMHSEALKMARAWDDRSLKARSLNNLGIALLSLGEYESARQALEESFALKDGYDDAWSLSTALGNLGIVLRRCGNYDEALDCHRRSRDLFKSIGDAWGELGELNFMADVLRDRLEYREAARLYARSLDANVERIRSAASDSLNGLASIAVTLSQFRRVAVLTGAVESIRSQTGGSDPISEGPLLRSALEAARTSLGSALFDEAFAEGGALSVAEAIEVGRIIARDLGA